MDLPFRLAGSRKGGLKITTNVAWRRRVDDARLTEVQERVVRKAYGA